MNGKLLGRTRGDWCPCRDCDDRPTRGQLRATDHRRWHDDVDAELNGQEPVDTRRLDGWFGSEGAE